MVIPYSDLHIATNPESNYLVEGTADYWRYQSALSRTKEFFNANPRKLKGFKKFDQAINLLRGRALELSSGWNMIRQDFDTNYKRGKPASVAPDYFLRRGGTFFVVEIKASTKGTAYKYRINRWQRECLRMARKFGFEPMALQVDIKLDVTVEFGKPDL